jgi:hypothetical protein
MGFLISNLPELFYLNRLSGDEPMKNDIDQKFDILIHQLKEGCRSCSLMKQANNLLYPKNK